MKNITLTKENAHKVATITSKSNPEWGTKRFNHNEDGEGMSTFGVGFNSAMLFDGEFKFWNVATWK